MSKLQLHQWYSVEEAIAAFGGEAESYCDGQIVVLPHAVLGIFPLADDSTASRVITSRYIKWLSVSPKKDIVLDEIWKWSSASPEKLLEMAQNGELCDLKPCYLLLRARNVDSSRYLYAGEAKLISFLPRAEFRLHYSLPWEFWLQLGGCPGWWVGINGEEYHVTLDDLAEFERLTAQLTETEFSHFWMTRYEDDALSVYTNANCAFPMYTRTDDDSGLYYLNPLYSGPSNARENFTCSCCNIDLEFPVSSTMAHAQAIRVARDYFLTGTLPLNINWVEIDEMYKAGKA